MPKSQYGKCTVYMYLAIKTLTSLFKYNQIRRIQTPAWWFHGVNRTADTLDMGWQMYTVSVFFAITLPNPQPTFGWRCGVAVGCRTRNQEVAGSSLGRALRRKNSRQVSHTYVPLSPSSITWYWPKGGDA